MLGVEVGVEVGRSDVEVVLGDGGEVSLDDVHAARLAPSATQAANVVTRAKKYRVLIGDHPFPNGSRATPDRCRKAASGPI